MDDKIVFCIWLGKKIKDEYLFNMNRTMTDLFIKNKELQFIFYTDNEFQMIKSILTCKYDLFFIKKNVQIKNIDFILKEYNYIVNIALKQYKSYFISNKNLLQIIENCSNNIIFSNDFFQLRENSIQWSLIYSSYLYRLLHNKIYLARASLNIRLLALSIHNGLYLDFDIITDSSIELFKFQEILEIYFKYKKIIKQFKNDINHLMSNQKINIFKKMIQKIEKLSIIFLPEINFTPLHI
jgi:hypothetical protein